MQKQRTTAQKLEIKRFLEANREREMTVAEIAAELSESGSGIGIATVYRAVKRLESDGIIIRHVTGSGNKAVYKYCGDESVRNMHMIFCRCCGKAVAINFELSHKFETSVSDKTGFSITDHQLLLYGLCPDCR
ncbi:MAG: transcriptional repressor [Clostridia bacterium]|nr:transcriptional repressor [Clostridia bacterium]